MSATVSSLRNEGGNIDDLIKKDKTIWKNKYINYFNQKKFSQNRNFDFKN